MGEQCSTTGRRASRAFAALLPAALTAGCAATGANLPTETADGLQLQPNTRFEAVYLRPGADFTIYDEFGLAPCQVSFKKNWLRDQNSNRVDLTNRVTQKDVDRIRDGLAKLCDEQFKQALLEDPAYTLVESFSEGEHVLVLEPAIVNLDITAPDVRSANVSYEYTTSSGEMTLALAAVDGTTRQTVAEVADRREETDDGTLQWTNSVTNRSDAERILGMWADQLRDGLDHLVRGQQEQ